MNPLPCIHFDFESVFLPFFSAIQFFIPFFSIQVFAFETLSFFVANFSFFNLQSTNQMDRTFSEGVSFLEESFLEAGSEHKPKNLVHMMISDFTNCPGPVFVEGVPVDMV